VENASIKSVEVVFDLPSGTKNARFLSVPPLGTTHEVNQPGQNVQLRWELADPPLGFYKIMIQVDGIPPVTR